MSPKTSSLAFDDVREGSHDQSEYGIALEPRLNLIVKTANRSSFLKNVTTEGDSVVIEGRITVSF